MRASQLRWHMFRSLLPEGHFSSRDGYQVWLQYKEQLYCLRWRYTIELKNISTIRKKASEL